MASSQDDSDWDKSTSEIQSEDSADLFASRPNRWRGPPQSWRTLTEEDRLTFHASERLRNQDLSVHLYNAFALKNTPTTTAHQRIDVGPQPEGSQPEYWAPPKSWTAWPLRVDLVPPDDFMKRTEDEDDVLTFRKGEIQAPSKQLEDVVSAAILRFAKEKFRKRQLDEAPVPAQDKKIVKNEPVSSGNQTTSSGPESEGDKEEVSCTSSQNARGKAVEKTYKPAVATDDDVSYELIRPSTRAILLKLDQTLRILHNTRISSDRGVMESASSTSDAEDDLYNEATPNGRRSRSRATPRSRPASRASSIASSLRARSRSPSRGATIPPSKSKSNSGRKAASVPREGESVQQFLRRRAKEQKKRRPVFSDDEITTAAEGAKSPPRKSRRRQARARSSDGEYWLEKKLDRFNLRDWSDVMGAAALAGFDADVIERATRRCANLFGQGMEMHTIDEHVRVQTKRYVPGQVVLSSDFEDEDEHEYADGHRKHSLSRHSSLVPSREFSLVSSDGDEHEDKREDEHRGIESFRKRQKRSSSRGSGLESYYCHHAGCERATRSFDRPANLRRHLERVHKEGDVQEGSTSHLEDEVSDKESHYCTHADCERATRPFDKRHNLSRHLQRVHGEEIGGNSKARVAAKKTPEALATGQYFCPHDSCERATRAFDRRPNLKRHLKLVHGETESRRDRQSTETGNDEGFSE